MGTICLPENAARTKQKSTLKRKFYSALFFLILWTVSLTVLVLGLPFILYQSITSLFSRKPTA